VGAPSQLPLDLPSRPALGRSAFFVTEANRVALAQIDAWPDWPSGRLAVAGPEGSGKTHLAHVWAARAGAAILSPAEFASDELRNLPGSGAVVIEDADRIVGGRTAEEALFHLLNRLVESGGSLLVTGREAPARWPIGLPDLASRLRVAAVARLEPPDDALLSAVLIKLFADRQLTVTPDLIRYLVDRMERAFAAAAPLVSALDQAALARRRPVTVRLAAEVLFEEDREG
jgi:DnaA regulatory inactivator Hda